MQTLILGAAAGFTIVLGLPLARLRRSSRRLQAAASGLATGILIFLLWDVLVHGVGPLEKALETGVAAGSWAEFAVLGSLLVLGVVGGFMSLVYYDAWARERRYSALVGPGAAANDEVDSRPWLMSLTAGRQLAMLIATGIGLHNFGEGLAIGQASAAGQMTLALTLVVGFGLHNATEGFGIVGPMSGEVDRPSWRFLALLGLIGGGPTFVGTVIGQAWVSEAVSVAFFAVAAGSILYVVQELFGVNRRVGFPVLGAWLIVVGLFLGYATDFVLEAAGG